MKFIFYNPVYFEFWDYRNLDEGGIGGSETSAVEMSRRLAKEGHDVKVYAPLREDSLPEYENVKWVDLNNVDWNEEGLWIIYRSPESVSKLTKGKDKQPSWLIMQDWSYDSLNESYIEQYTRILAIGKTQQEWLLQQYPSIKNNLFRTSNGIRLDKIEELDNTLFVRNPKKVVYTSSPDRGLLAALKIYEKAKFLDPQLEFHCYYGFDNIDRLIVRGIYQLAELKEQCLELMDKLKVKFHGRLSQVELYKELFTANTLLYCTEFLETGWISGLEAAACGVFPIFSPVGAQIDIMEHGAVIRGNPKDPLTIANFAGTLFKFSDSIDYFNYYRGPMMHWARSNWTWDRFVIQWIGWANQDLR